MKRIIFIFVTFICNYSFAQNLPRFDDIKLEQASDYKSADTFALQASTYLLSTPYEKDDLTRLKSTQFMIRWMTGTPDYTFSLDEVAGKIIKGNDDLLTLYMAAMTKYCLENKASSKDKKLIRLNAIILLINYCENKDNNMKMTKQLTKLSEAKDKGQLEQSL